MRMMPSVEYRCLYLCDSQIAFTDADAAAAAAAAAA